MNDASLLAQTLAALEGDSLSWVIVLGVILGSIFGVYLLVKAMEVIINTVGAVFGLIGGFLGRVGLFAGRQIQDALHLVGGLLTGVVIAPLAVANGLIGRLGNAAHYGRALRSELLGAGAGLYRIALGNPLWFLGLSALTDGLERRLPELVSRAPHEARLRRFGETPRRHDRGSSTVFEGYTVTGELEPGGSGARLLLASPDDATLARYRTAGHADPGQVVIKSFDLKAGSTVPQIVRESRSLEAARRLGLVLDHELDEESFWYVMPYVPGEDLDVVTRRLHARAGEGGLNDRGLSRVLGYASDLLTTLNHFHSAGLWHKDIKPSNLIVTDDRAHLVDLGLVTPLASAMTLTTHGTEFFRDPELVRMAMKGAKVQEIDGVKFDLYSVGAVLYSMVENSFPAHGNLSRFEKRCPDALSFIVRRAMADLSQRYASADEMNRDLDVLIAARDPWAVKPADLPSLSGEAGARRPRAAAYRAELPMARPAAVPVGHPPQPVREQRVRSRGLLGPLSIAVLFLVMAGGIAVVVRTARARANALLYRETHSTHMHPHYGDPSDIALAPTSHDHRPPAGRNDRARLARGDAGSALRELGVDSRILLLTTAGLGLDDPKVLNLREVLESRGHRLVGEGSDPPSIELAAQAQAAVGLANLSDGAAVGRLQDFLERSEGVDALVWLGPSSGGEVGFRILVRESRQRRDYSSSSSPR